MNSNLISVVISMFQEECLRRLDNRPADQPKIKRRNVNPYGEIVTSDAVFEKVFNDIQMEEEKKSKKNTRKIARRKKLELDSETEEGMVESSSDGEESDKDDSDQRESIKMTFPDSPRSIQKFLKICWESFSPSVPERDLINAWYSAIFYEGKKKGTLYLGRIKKRFLKEKDGTVDSFELACFKPSAAPSATVIEEPPIHLGPDLSLFRASDIIAGPLKSVTYMESRKWRFMEYFKLYNYYKMVQKIDRQAIYI